MPARTQPLKKQSASQAGHQRDYKPVGNAQNSWNGWANEEEDDDEADDGDDWGKW